MGNDLGEALRKAGLKTGGGAVKKKCRVCGKVLKTHSRFDTCYDCGKKKRKHNTGGWQRLPEDYLKKLDEGFFDDRGCLREEFVTTMADEVAKSFGKVMKNHQLRRYYGHAKAAENRLQMTGDWRSVNVDIKKLRPFVSEARGKGKVPESFYEFIDRNVSRIKNEDEFRAFMEHFQAVVAFFTFHYPRS